MKLYTLPLKKLKNVDPSDVTVAVYGLGKMGLPLAVVFADKGFTVIGVGKTPDNIAKINQGKSPVTGEDGLDSLLKKVVKKGKLTATTDGTLASKKADIKIIIIPTYLDQYNNPDLTLVQEVTEKIASGLQKGDVVILESTAPPGTTIELIGRTLEKISGLKLNHDFGVAHCPERTSSGKAIYHITGGDTPKIVGGSDKKTTAIIKYLYEQINSKGVVVVKNTKIAEMVKISEGLYRDVNIALANNLYLICKELRIDATEVIQAANTDIVCHLLNPGPGVGGHCIPVYPYFILKKIRQNKELLSLSRSINDTMSTHIIDLAREALSSKGVDIKNSSILVCGIAYRAGVKETRKSPGLKIAHELGEVSDSVFAYDPLFNEADFAHLKLKYRDDFKGIDCVIITTAEDEFKKLNWNSISKELHTKVIIDCNNIIDAAKLEKLGFTIRRIGYSI